MNALRRAVTAVIDFAGKTNCCSELPNVSFDAIWMEPTGLGRSSSKTETFHTLSSWSFLHEHREGLEADPDIQALGELAVKWVKEKGQSIMFAAGPDSPGELSNDILTQYFDEVGSFEIDEGQIAKNHSNLCG